VDGKSHATATCDLNRNQSRLRIGGTIREHGTRGSINAEDSFTLSWRVSVHDNSANYGNDWR
jgi:hypothetical protein